MLFNWLAEWKRNGRIRSTKRRANRRQRQHSASVPNEAEVLEERTLLTQFIVTTLADEAFDGMETNNAGDGTGLSLREAIGLANANGGLAGETGEADGDTIVFAPSIAGGTITLVLGELLITDDLEIDGADQDVSNGDAGRMTINGNFVSRIFHIETAGFGGTEFDVLLSNLIVTNGRVDGDGGGILITSTEDVSLANMEITNNSASSGSGGGIANGGGTANVINSTISGNSASIGGGGLYNFGGTMTVLNSTVSGNTANRGGGVFNYFFATANVINSTISGNSAGAGGGIFNKDRQPLLQLGSKVNVTNSTLSGNVAGGRGGGIYSDSLLNIGVDLTNSTISGNVAGGGGGIYSFQMTSVRNSIITGNNAGTNPDVRGIFISNSHNVGGDVGTSSGFGAGDNIGAAPASVIKLSLADNGGPTLTHALVPGSPAIDAGLNADAVDPQGNPLLTDQRGEPFVRIFGDQTDIGAFELQPGPGILVAAPGPGVPSNVQVRNAETNEVMLTLEPYPGFFGGVRVAVGDVDGDLTPDIITAPGPNGGPHIRVFSGVDGTDLGSFFAYNPRFVSGVFVASADIDGDGFADIITGADAGGGPHVRVFSGADFSELFSFFAFGEFFAGGVRVAAGDISGDGVPDLIAGAGPGAGPHIRIFDGITGDQIVGRLGSFYAFDQAFRGGVFVAAGDVNGDQGIDLIIGAGAGAGPHVRVFDRATGDQLAGPVGSFYAFDSAFPGGVRVAASDINGDSRADIVAAAGPGSVGPLVRIFNAASTGAVPETLREFTVEHPVRFAGGVFVAASVNLESVVMTLGSASENLDELFADDELLGHLLS